MRRRRGTECQRGTESPTRCSNRCGEGGRRSPSGHVQRHRAVDRCRSDAGHRAARQHQHVGIGAHRPFGEHDEDGRGGRAERAGRRRRAPGDEQRGATSSVKAISASRHARSTARSASRRTDRRRATLDDTGSIWPSSIVGAEHEAADHEQCGEHEARDHMEGVRRDQRRAAIESGEDPEHGEHDGRHREPAPQPDTREAKAAAVTMAR